MTVSSTQFNCAWWQLFVTPLMFLPDQAGHTHELTGVRALICICPAAATTGRMIPSEVMLVVVH
uniref:Uncharacterized protein n=1 Tax=Leersia perrieri TaxID=77586 RepID=A0A0D9X2Y0_9ORYZ